MVNDMRANFETGMKYCPACETNKEIVEFYKCKKWIDGLQNRCKTCQNKIMIDLTSTRYELPVSIIYGVYRKSDPTRKIVYVGESLLVLNNRINRHKCDAKTQHGHGKFIRAIKEDGIEAFEFVIITDKFSEHYTEAYFINLLQPELNTNKGNTTRQVREIVQVK